METLYFGGLDFGTSGARITIIKDNAETVFENSTNYKYEFKNPMGWILACEKLLESIPIFIKDNLSKLSISGTSGTLLACSLNGNSLGDAIPYNTSCNVEGNLLNAIAGDNKLLNNSYSSLSKALELLDIYGPNILLRHQSDWIAGWLLKNWKFGEEGNNIKLGWDLSSLSWPKNFYSTYWHKSLPFIRKSGEILGIINIGLAKKLNLNQNLCIIAGTTDSNASYLAAKINDNDGLTVLGTTIVLKKSTSKPIKEEGLTNHRINDQWICGGASNAGCGVLSRFFSDLELEELSKQINPKKTTNLKFIPLNSRGERFPVNDPDLEPLVEPRPVSDALFLHALLEGLANVELRGWKKLEQLTGKFPKRIVTIGGGAKNPQWRKIREKIIKVPIISCNKNSSYGSALLSLRSNHLKFT
tara:strand:+ start:1878 stop:3122 length:1245 start_codon:yes stop_codon:yes gene_type:complete